MSGHVLAGFKITTHLPKQTKLVCVECDHIADGVVSVHGPRVMLDVLAREALAHVIAHHHEGSPV